MDQLKIAGFFAGQGVLQNMLPDSSSFLDCVRDTFHDIDRVATDRFGICASGGLPKSTRQVPFRLATPELMQLAVFGYSLASYRHDKDRDRHCSVLFGHGLGEIIALSAAGAFSVREGAEIVCERAAVLKQFAEGLGSMIAVTAPAHVAEQLIQIVRPAPASVAAENSHTNTVVAGSYAALDGIIRLANALNIESKKLTAAYPLHCAPLMENAAAELSKRLDALIGAAPCIPVFSPILGEYYEEIDSAGASIAEHLVKRIQFVAAVNKLRADGIDAFVECGILSGLTSTFSYGARDAERRAVLAA